MKLATQFLVTGIATGVLTGWVVALKTGISDAVPKYTVLEIHDNRESLLAEQCSKTFKESSIQSYEWGIDAESGDALIHMSVLGEDRNCRRDSSGRLSYSCQSGLKSCGSAGPNPPTLADVTKAVEDLSVARDEGRVKGRLFPVTYWVVDNTTGAAKYTTRESAMSLGGAELRVEQWGFESSPYSIEISKVPYSSET